EESPGGAGGGGGGAAGGRAAGPPPPRAPPPGAAGGHGGAGPPGARRARVRALAMTLRTSAWRILISSMSRASPHAHLPISAVGHDPRCPTARPRCAASPTRDAGGRPGRHPGHVARCPRPGRAAGAVAVASARFTGMHRAEPPPTYRALFEIPTLGRILL